MPMAAVKFLVLMGGAPGPLFIIAQNEMLHCVPGRTDIALAANSGAYNTGIAADAALGALVLPLAGACAVLLSGRLLPRSPLLGSRSRCSVDALR
ncbi:hypothetical protein AQI95_44080 [Streptomyces yokosukanensis]|uniref:Uncharacterized protein n=1 Tax=Streptomyces yokosukanensis TaxID=67386 RepID=A0A124HBW5_9ACTN|nr:hypothetical protein AQI95_44080 [Streptomyces yokosukanensis]